MSQLAAKLVGMGIRPNVAVGIMIDRSVDLMVTILGVLKSGGGVLLTCLRCCSSGPEREGLAVVT